MLVFAIQNESERECEHSPSIRKVYLSYLHCNLISFSHLLSMWPNWKSCVFSTRALHWYAHCVEMEKNEHWACLNHSDLSTWSRLVFILATFNLISFTKCDTKANLNKSHHYHNNNHFPCRISRMWRNSIAFIPTHLLSH